MTKTFLDPYTLKLRSGYHEIFWYCETKKIRQKNVVFRFHAQKVPIPEIFPKIEGLPTKFFSTGRRKKNQRKIAMPPSEHKVFDVPKILKQRGIP